MDEPNALDQMQLQRDAKRWAWFRAHWARLVFHSDYHSLTGRRRMIGMQLKNASWSDGEPESVDKAFDDMMEKHP